MHRALAWNRKLSGTAGLSQAELARREGITAVTLTYHLKLLKLAPEIQEFLLAVAGAEGLRRFSLRRMKALAELDYTAQRKAFVRMRAE